MTTLGLNHNFRNHVLYYYNKFASLYDLGEIVRKSTRQKAVTLSGWQPGERVLDLCTGTGELGLTFANAGAPVIGVDLARGMLKRAHTKTRRADASWLEMDAMHLAFPDNAFDVAVLSLALHHMPEAVQINVLKELSRVARRKVVIIEPDVPVKPNWTPIWIFVAQIIDESEYMHEWAVQDFPATCHKAGLDVEMIHESTFGLHRLVVCTPVT